MIRGKSVLRKMPVLGPALLSAKRARDRRRFPGSAAYWEERYQEGGTSGPGSAGINARFKADTLNRFVRAHGVRDVIEFGCGDGQQLELAKYPRYIGLDVAKTSVAMCRARFANDATKAFRLYPSTEIVPGRGAFVADLSLSLDVIYHLVEDAVFGQHMSDVFAASRRWVILYTSDSDRIRGATEPHCRHRPVARYVEQAFPDWGLSQRIPNANPLAGDPERGSSSDFYVYQRLCLPTESRSRNEGPL